MKPIVRIIFRLFNFLFLFVITSFHKFKKKFNPCAPHIHSKKNKKRNTKSCAKRRNENKKEVQVAIESFSVKGKGIGHFLEEGHIKKVQIPNTVVGDTVVAELKHAKRREYKGCVRLVVTPSSTRVSPSCMHTAVCGGCVWQEMDYTAQVKEKEQRVRTLFSPLLVDTEVVLHPIIPCAFPWRYRNKMEFSFSQNKEKEKFLGLVLEGTKGHVFNLKECHLSSCWFSQAVEHTRAWWRASALSAYHPIKNTGSLRTLTLREGKNTGNKMAILTVAVNPAVPLKKLDLHGFVAAIRASVSNEELCSLSIFLCAQQTIKGSPTQFYEICLSGPDHIQEVLHVEVEASKRPFTFKISPTSFFQPNTKQAEVLYARSLELVGDLEGKRVLDLYCGMAPLGILMAPLAKEVIGIELNPHAIFDAEANKELNNIDNLTLYCGDAGKILSKLKDKNIISSIDVAMIDPPRAGMDASTLDSLLFLQPKKILYISCNPLTQFENIQALLGQKKYKLTSVQPIDLFPHTIHTENIALLERI